MFAGLDAAPLLLPPGSATEIALLVGNDGLKRAHEAHRVEVDRALDEVRGCARRGSGDPAPRGGAPARRERPDRGACPPGRPARTSRTRGRAGPRRAARLGVLAADRSTTRPCDLGPGRPARCGLLSPLGRRGEAIAAAWLSRQLDAKTTSGRDQSRERAVVADRPGRPRASHGEESGCGAGQPRGAAASCQGTCCAPARRDRRRAKHGRNRSVTLDSAVACAAAQTSLGVTETTNPGGRLHSRWRS